MGDCFKFCGLFRKPELYQKIACDKWTLIEAKNLNEWKYSEKESNTAQFVSYKTNLFIFDK